MVTLNLHESKLTGRVKGELDLVFLLGGFLGEIS